MLTTNQFSLTIQDKPVSNEAQETVVQKSVQQDFCTDSKAWRTLEERAEPTASRDITGQSAELFPQVCGWILARILPGEVKFQISNVTDFFLVASRGEKLTKTQPHM